MLWYLLSTIEFIYGTINGITIYIEKKEYINFYLKYEN